MAAPGVKRTQETTSIAMKLVEGVLATTHLDRHNERFTLEALEGMARQLNKQYVPFGYNHDPRIPPLGRTIHAKVNQRDDGEYNLETVSELFEPGDKIELKDDTREIPTNNIELGEFIVTYDRNFRGGQDQEDLNEISSLLNTEALEESKKAFEPLSVLTIGCAAAAGAIATGFLGALGTDAYKFLKEKVKALMRREKEDEKERLLKFQATVYIENRIFDVEVILTNPSESDIDSFFDNGIKELDQILPPYLHDGDIKRIVLEYESKQLDLKFGVRKDAVPIHPISSAT